MAAFLGTDADQPGHLSRFIDSGKGLRTSESRILRGILPPACCIIESHIADPIGASRTPPVRDTPDLLEREGPLEFIPRVRYGAQAISGEEVEESCRMRPAKESLGLPQTIQPANQSHRRILARIKTRDAQQAVEMFKLHLEETKASIIRYALEEDQRASRHIGQEADA